MNFFQTFSECSLPSTVRKKAIKLIGPHACLRAVMGQSYPIYAYTCANLARYVSVNVTSCGSWKHSVFKQYLGREFFFGYARRFS